MQVETEMPEALLNIKESTGQVEMGEASSPNQEQPSALDMIQLSVYEIDDNPFQPRREFSESEIASLSESLKSHDMLPPVLVVCLQDNHGPNHSIPS